MILKITNENADTVVMIDPVAVPLSMLDPTQRKLAVDCLALNQTVRDGGTVCERETDLMSITEWAEREGISRQRAHILAKKGRIPSVLVHSLRGKVRMVPREMVWGTMA